MDKKLVDERIKWTLDYLKEKYINTLELGKHIINDWLYINVQEYETKLLQEDSKFESHKKYLDIQMMINGIEAIEVADVDKLVISQNYDDEKDVMFWNHIDNQMKSVISNGSYVILYPQNAHLPCIAVDKPTKVRKLVAKVYLS